MLTKYLPVQVYDGAQVGRHECGCGAQQLRGELKGGLRPLHDWQGSQHLHTALSGL